VGWLDHLDPRVHETADAVVVECRYQGVYKPTGKNMDLQVCHVWKVADGKLKSFHQYIDTARLQEIMSAPTGAVHSELSTS
jgi:ketosteroid isomerase-like protein